VFLVIDVTLSHRGAASLFRRDYTDPGGKKFPPPLVRPSKSAAGRDSGGQAL